MKGKLIILIIISILFLQVWTQLNPYIFKGNKISYKPHNNKMRKASDNSYESIRIYSDYSYIKYQSQENSNLIKIETEIENAMEYAIKIIKKLINVIPLTNPINIITQEDLTEWGFKTDNINKSLLKNNAGVDADLIVLLKFIETGEENLLLDNENASFSNKFILDEKSKNRPIVGVIYINTNLDVDKGNFDIFLKSIFLHELTHILGFHYDLFQYFPGGLEKTIKTENEVRRNIQKKFITTPKVLEFAKKYFNCKEMTGVELENQHNIKWSHWEARILLGEYMTSDPYTPEQIISEFTLSLLEDSGWYKVNYYTGGLMRFGKNKGCEFLQNDCIDTNGNSIFKYEFCNILDGNSPTCSSGRQSRTYCISDTNSNFDKAYKRLGDWIGRKNADYCPVSDIDEEEEKQLYYVGNCKYGNGKYGTHNNFEDNSLTNGDFEEILGEKYGTNSFCALSSILPETESNKFSSYINSLRAICYPMFCNSKFLTIQVYEKYIVCPREGGKVEINGKYKGYLICPDYNLICTGTKVCNDMFDCVEKESLSKENTFSYDYDINIDEEKIYKAEEIPELVEDELCPKNCAECKNGKCIKCLDGYIFVSENKDSSSIQCIKKDEINIEKYCYNKNGIYYFCDWEVEKSEIDENIEKEILKGNIDDIIKKYIEKSNLIEKLIIYYSNEEEDISIIIFKGKGNKESIESISSVNEKEILEALNENYPNDNNKIKAILKINGTYYVSIYDEAGNELNIKDECPDCSNIKVNIKNNYENYLNKKLGEAIKTAILNNKINIFDEESPIFNDICSNFTVSGIDIPLNSRKDIFYLGDNKSEIICGDANCQIIKDNYNTNQLEGECKCDINFDLTNINANFEEKNENKKESNENNLSSSEKTKNSFQIFKCFKTGNFLKKNEGFYITICSIGIQSACFALYIIFTPKIPLLSTLSLANPIQKKNNTEKNKNKNNNNNNSYHSEESGDIINEKEENEKKAKINGNNLEKIENNVMNYGNIDEEITDDEKISNNNNVGGISNTNFHYRENNNEIKLDTIKIENKANFKLNKNLSIKSNEDKNIDESDELNKKYNFNTLNTNANNLNTNYPIYNATTEGDKNKQKESADYDQFSIHGSVNKKLNIKENEEKDEKEEKIFDEKTNNNKKVLILFGDKKKYNKTNRSIKNYEKKKEIPLDYLTLEKAKQYDKRSFGIIYWCVFSFKQPIINILSFFDAFQITKSCIPIQMKLIRFLLMLILNIFINSMTITQEYFKKKYEYFNEKYQIEASENMKIKIDPLERLSYAMKHCFPEVIVTFIICMIIQYIINFIFFGIRRELCLISINEKKENLNKAVEKLVKKAKVRYIIFSFINLVFMIIFFVYLTNFSTAYSGGALDYIGAGIWTFIFLQILPIFSSLIIALLRYYGIKKNKEGMYKISQVLLA